MGAVSGASRCFYAIRWCRILEISEPLKRRHGQFCVAEAPLSEVQFVFSLTSHDKCVASDRGLCFSSEGAELPPESSGHQVWMPVLDAPLFLPLALWTGFCFQASGMIRMEVLRVWRHFLLPRLVLRLSDRGECCNEVIIWAWTLAHQ